MCVCVCVCVLCVEFSSVFLGANIHICGYIFSVHVCMYVCFTSVLLYCTVCITSVEEKVLEGVRRAAEEVGSSLKDGGWCLIELGVSGCLW